MPLISQTTEYAIRAMIELARQPEDSALLARELTEKTGVPQFYLSKILHALARQRLLTSNRGRGGGFRLSRPASEITLAMVVEHFEDLRSNSECLLGRPRCSDAEACPMHEFWKEMRERYVKELETRTLADLAAHEELWQAERYRAPSGHAEPIATKAPKPAKKPGAKTIPAAPERKKSRRARPATRK
jgi:Rrf2 family protein